MRILFDARRATAHRTTGIGRVIDGLLGSLAAQDCYNQYLVLYGEKNPLEGEETAHFETRHSGPDINSPAVNWMMPQIARAWRADVAYFPFWLMPLMMPCPTVMVIHDLLFSAFPGNLSPPRRLAYRVYTALAARAARRIHTVSVFSRSELRHFFRVPADRVDVISNAASATFVQRPFSAVDEETLKGKALSAPYALYVGNHKPHKNLERLLVAYSRVADQIEVDLVIAGAKASYEDPFALPYLERTRRLGLDDRVRFLGQVSDQELVTLYQAARFFIFPSLYEGFGMPPLEAMRCGTPVACSNTSSLPEVVGDAALTFDPLDVGQVVEAMLRLDQSEELRIELRRRGLERAKRFSWQESARRWLASMEKAAQEK